MSAMNRRVGANDVDGVSEHLEPIRAFLSERFARVRDVEELQRGGWSSAYSFRSGRHELILRVGYHAEDFAKERYASTWHAAGVPVPDVLDLGEAFDGYYIVSRRHEGQKLADLDPSRVPRVLGHLFEVLEALRRIELPGQGYGIWTTPDADAPGRTWGEHLRGVEGRDESRLVGWREKLAARGCAALDALTLDVPETRRLVHADLLLNHLVGSNDEVTAVFDWGNAMAGDPLFDIAWIVYCIPWFPAIDRRHVLGLARRHFPGDDVDRLLPLYELHIGVASLQYQAFADDLLALEISTSSIARLLRGLEGHGSP
jgi:hygromycin-B 4-O-kinase